MKDVVHHRWRVGKALITAYERGEFKPVKDQKGAKQTALKAAKRYERLTASGLSGKKEG